MKQAPPPAPPDGPGRPLRVGVVIPSFYPAVGYGGPIFTSLHTAEALAARGVDVRVITTNADVRGRLEVDTHAWQELATRLNVRYYRDTVRERLSVPLLRGVRRDLADVDVVFVQAMFSTPVLFALASARSLGKPTVLTPHGALGAWCLEQGLSPRLKAAWLRWLVGPLARDTVWHATTESEAEEIRAQFPEARVVTIPNGIDVELFERPERVSARDLVRRFHGIDPGADAGPAVVSLGRLHKKKGFDTLIDAFARLRLHFPSAVLCIAGFDEGEGAALHERIERLGLGGCAFIRGAIDGPDKVTFLASGDVFALPSHHENFGLVYAEALAAGTPVIASRDTPWQAVVDRDVGRWVEAEPAAFAAALASILRADHEAMGQRGRAWAREAFAWPRIARELEGVFRELAGFAPLPPEAEPPKTQRARRPRTSRPRPVVTAGRPLRLGLVIPSFYPAVGFGGPIFTSLHTAQHLARRGVEVSVVTTNADVGGRLDVDTRRWHELEPRLRVRYFADTVTDRLSVPLLAGIRGALRDVDVISVQALFSVPVLAGLAVAATSGRPAVLTPRGALGAWCLEQGLSPALKRAWLQRLVGPLTRRAVWHATSPGEADEIRLQFPSARVEVAPNGIDVDLFDHPTRLSRPDFVRRFLGVAPREDEPGPIVVSLGRLHEKKGFDVLIDAFARFAGTHPGALLAIAGPDYGLRPTLLERVAAAGLEGRAFVLDPVAGADKVTFLASGDLFALPSHHENFGVVFAEALAAGTPVIASRDTPWQEVELHRAGRWVDASAEAVARAMGEIVAEGPREMGQRGRRWALEAFAWPKIAAQLEALYRELAGFGPREDLRRTP